MSISGERLARAQARSDRARAELMATVNELQDRLSPQTLARKASEQIIGTGEEIASAGIVAARRHSGGIAKVAAGLAALIAVRRLFRWRSRRKAAKAAEAAEAEQYATGAADSSLIAEQAKGHRRRRSR
ncbi:MAG: DUF3618 domain-containing protein [Sphingomonas sp.]